MTIQVPDQLQKQLRELASQQGRAVDAVVEEAIRQYLAAADLADVTPEELAATQEQLIGEMTDVPPWTDEGDHAAG